MKKLKRLNVGQLALARETVRVLTDPEIERAAGGWAWTSNEKYTGKCSTETVSHCPRACCV